MFCGGQGCGVLIVGIVLGVGISWVGLVLLEWWWEAVIAVHLFPAEIFHIDFFLSGIVAFSILVLGGIPILLSLQRALRRSVLSNILDLS